MREECAAGHLSVFYSMWTKCLRVTRIDDSSVLSVFLFVCLFLPDLCCCVLKNRICAVVHFV